MVVVLVTSTGIALNHTSEFKLSKLGVDQPWLLALYGIERAELRSVAVDSYWISGDETGQIYFQDQQIARCAGILKGAVPVTPFIVVACTGELVLLSEDGVFQERLGDLYGIPQSISEIGLCGERVCLKLSDSVSEFDLASLELSSWEGGGEVLWSAPAIDSASIEALASLSQDAGTQRLDWERVLLDLHSGRIAGYPGVVIVDLAALGMLFLALSGFWIWYRRAASVNRRKR